MHTLQGLTGTVSILPSRRLATNSLSKSSLKSWWYSLDSSSRRVFTYPSDHLVARWYARLRFILLTLSSVVVQDIAKIISFSRRNCAEPIIQSNEFPVFSYINVESILAQITLPETPESRLNGKIPVCNLAAKFLKGYAA